MSASYNAVTINATATSILASSPGRRGLIIKNNGGQTIYLGLDSGVTTSNGIPLLPQDTFTLTGEHNVFKGSVWGITASATSDARYWDYTP